MLMRMCLRHARALVGVLPVILVAGCSTSHSTLPDGSTPNACSVDATDPSLPGVTLHVEADACTFDEGEGGVFRYRLTLPSPIDFAVDTFPGCGACAAYSSDPASLLGFVVGSGLVRYCRCDEGCCAPQEPASYTIAAGTVEGSFEWPGRTWNGPSDTDNPLGDPFPPGDYPVTVTFAVPGGGSVEAVLPIIVR